jgi:hypothetical protein
MVITYLVRREPHTLEVCEEEDLRHLVEEVWQELQARHPELGGEPGLRPRLIDGLLNGLADGSEEIALGELGTSP